MKEIIVDGKMYFLYSVKNFNDKLIMALNDLADFKKEIGDCMAQMEQIELTNFANPNNAKVNSAIKEFALNGISDKIPLKLLVGVLMRVDLVYKALQEYDLHDVILTDRQAKTDQDFLLLALEAQYQKDAPHPDHVRLLPFCDSFFEW